MIVMITCPRCKVKDCIEAIVSNKDTGDVISYPEECPNCGTEVTNDMLGEIQAQAQEDLFGHMIDQVWERQKERELDKYL